MNEWNNENIGMLCGWYIVISVSRKLSFFSWIKTSMNVKETTRADQMKNVKIFLENTFVLEWGGVDLDTRGSMAIVKVNYVHH